MVAESTRPRVLFAQHMGPHKFLDVLPRLWWFVSVVVPSSPNLHQPKHLVSIQCTVAVHALFVVQVRALVAEG